MTRQIHRALFAHLQARTLWMRLRFRLNRARRGIDGLVDNGAALDILIAAISYVIFNLFVGPLGSGLASFIVTLVTKRARIRLERWLERESAHPSARRWAVVGAGFIMFLDTKTASAARWLLGKLGLSSGHAHGAINTGALASQAAATAAATVVAFGAVQGAQAVLPDGQPRGEIVAFAPLTLEDWENFQPAESIGYRIPIPANATKPDGIRRSCQAPILGVYIEYRQMEEEMRVELPAYLDDELFAPDEFVWESRYPSQVTEVRDVQGIFIGEKSPSGEPLPSGEWRYVVIIDGERSDEATLTLENENCGQ